MQSRFVFFIITILFFFPACSDLKNIEENKTNLISNVSLSGEYFGNQTWSGNIIITGDVTMHGDLKILPGTRIYFLVSDDTRSGQEVGADGFNDNDPTRLLEYTKSHSELTIKGKLTAIGEDYNIIFTSKSKVPKFADWVGIKVEHDNSIIENCIVEWSRNGIVIKGNQSSTLVKNNIINNTFWGGINIDDSSPKIYNNIINEAGHEGIDVQAGYPDIRHNHITNSKTGIVVLGGLPTIINNTMLRVGKGIHSLEGIKINKSGNIFSFAINKNWTYENFSYYLHTI